MCRQVGDAPLPGAEAVGGGGSSGSAGGGGSPVASAGGGNVAPGGGAVGSGGGTVGSGGGDARTPPDSGVVTVVSALPPLPEMINVTLTQREDSVGIDFDPVEGAVDYRVYALPADGGITVDSSGAVTVLGATYRCAGLRQAYDLVSNLNANDPSVVVEPLLYNWTASVDANPTLGYVYVTPGAGRVPVYAVAGYHGVIDGQWRESRFKIYTTDTAVRQSYLAKQWRDDGIVFYVPAAASASTHTVYGSQTWDGTAGSHYHQYYFLSAAVSQHTGDTTPAAPAFEVLTSQEAGTQPLMAVTYEEDSQHTELAVGQERFHRAAYQGNGPLWHLEWSGITQPMVLVVEALSTGCPYQGLLSPQHIDAPPHQVAYTLDELRARSPTGEVFVNGQYDVTANPQAVARSFVAVAPFPHDPAAWDWYQGFNTPESPGAFTPPQQCGLQDVCEWPSPIFDLGTQNLDNPNGVTFFGVGTRLGELSVVYDDWTQDVIAKAWFGTLQKTSVDTDSNKYLHVTFTTNIVGSDRRYPELIVSDQDLPVFPKMSLPDHNTLIVQTIDGPSMNVQAQAIHGLVNGRTWDINNQADAHIFSGDMQDQRIIPVEPIFEHAGVDRMTTFDAYISSQQLYVFVDGTPVGCTRYPAGFVLGGAVTVTFGDVIYHEGAADEYIWYPAPTVSGGTSQMPYSFLSRHQATETQRQWDDLGFKSGVAAPAWDEGMLPCEDY